MRWNTYLSTLVLKMLMSLLLMVLMQITLKVFSENPRNSINQANHSKTGKATMYYLSKTKDATGKNIIFIFRAVKIHLRLENSRKDFVRDEIFER